MSTVPWNAIYGGGSLDFGTKLVCACCGSVEQSGVGWSSLKPSSPLIGFVSEIRNVLKYHSSCSRRERKRRDIPRTLPCSVDFSFPSLSSSSFLNLSISPCRPSWEHTLCMFFQLCISVCVILCVCSSENSVGLAWVRECMRSCREEMPSNGFRSLVDSVCDISCGGSLKVGSLAHREVSQACWINIKGYFRKIRLSRRLLKLSVLIKQLNESTKLADIWLFVWVCVVCILYIYNFITKRFFFRQFWAISLSSISHYKWFGVRRNLLGWKKLLIWAIKQTEEQTADGNGW